ncbi:MAG: hypothetical protein LBI85_07740 [Spirochaetaceae bacterium]|nr:hypothetical protein [Spirochaetaceae bacterium]
MAALEDRGFRAEVRELFPAFGAFGASVHVRLEPSPDTGRDALVLAMPLYGDGDSGQGRYDMDEALLLLEKLAAQPLGTEIRVAFLGSEYSRLGAEIDAPRYSGLKDLLSLYPETAKLIYLDLPAAPGGLLIHNGSRGNLSPLEMIRLFSRLCEEEKVPYVFSVYFNELYKLFLAGETGPLETAQSRDFPSFFIEGREGPPLGEGKLAALLYRYLEGLDAVPSDMDYHYSLFHVPGRTFYLSETATALLFLAVAALTLFILLMYFLVKRRLLVLQWKVFFTRFWVVALLFLLLAVSLFGAELWSDLVKRLLGLEERSDMLLAALKIVCALALYNFLVPYFSRIRIPRKGNYFGNAAVILTIAGSMIAAALDLSFVLLFLWAYLFALLGSVFRKAPLVIACALLTPLQILSAFIELARGGYTRLFELIGSGNIYITLYAALILLPSFLLLHRAEYLSRRNRAKKARATGKAVRDDGTSWRPRAGHLIKKKRLSAVGVSLLLFFSGALWLSRTPREGPARRLAQDGLLSVNAESSVFLDRRIIRLSLEAGQTPLLFTLSLESREPLVIYDSPMPYRFSQDNRSVSFILGEEPDNPFHTELVLPQDFSGSIRAAMLYRPLPARSGGDDYILSVEKTLPLP